MRSFVAGFLVAAASSVVAAPYGDKSVSVVLTDDAHSLTTTGFKSVNVRKTKAPIGGSSRLYTSIEVSVGEAANQNLRCLALGQEGIPISANRTTNFDITFSDGGKGAWKFDKPVATSLIVCDLPFITNGFDVTVVLTNPDTSYLTKTLFKNFVERIALPPSIEGPFKTVEISVGPNVDLYLHCKPINKKGRAIIADRGDKVDITFSDADKGPWTFETLQAKVCKIICDPAFVASPQ